MLFAFSLIVTSWLKLLQPKVSFAQNRSKLHGQLNFFGVPLPPVLFPGSSSALLSLFPIQALLGLLTVLHLNTASSALQQKAHCKAEPDCLLCLGDGLISPHDPPLLASKQSWRHSPHFLIPTLNPLWQDRVLCYMYTLPHS